MIWWSIFALSNLSYINSSPFQVTESHQSSKVDTSGTAKAIVSCFQRLGVSYDPDQVSLSALSRLKLFLHVHYKIILILFILLDYCGV